MVFTGLKNDIKKERHAQTETVPVNPQNTLSTVFTGATFYESVDSVFCGLFKITETLLPERDVAVDS